MAWPLVQACDSTGLLVSGVLLKPHVNVLLQLFASILFNREMTTKSQYPLQKQKCFAAYPTPSSSFPVHALNPRQLQGGAGGAQDKRFIQDVMDRDSGTNKMLEAFQSNGRIMLIMKRSAT